MKYKRAHIIENTVKSYANARISFMCVWNNEEKKYAYTF